jgi:predicted nuclease of predicted toxin-antitoxin system
VRFKTDENLPEESAAILREAGHDAHTIREQTLGGHPDGDVAAVCKREQRALVTLDLDFSDIRSYPPEDYHGLVVLRLRSQDRGHVLNVLRRLLPLFDREPLVQHSGSWRTTAYVSGVVDEVDFTIEVTCRYAVQKRTLQG